MARRLRGELGDGWFHVMNRGVARRQIFDTVSDGAHFLELLGEAVTDSELEVHAYCLMPNHFHVLARGCSSDLSHVMHSVGTNYSRYYNRRNGRDGPLFRARFHAKSVATDAYIVTVGRYIHRNPIGRVGVNSLARYRWSSLGEYVNLRPAPGWLSTAATLDEVGGPVAYEAFVKRDDSSLDVDLPPVDLDWVFATAIEVADLPTRLNSKGLARCVALCLLDGARAERARQLRDWVGCGRDEEPVLLARANARVGRNPEIFAAIDEANRILDQAA